MSDDLITRLRNMRAVAPWDASTLTEAADALTRQAEQLRLIREQYGADALEQAERELALLRQPKVRTHVSQTDRDVAAWQEAYEAADRKRAEAEVREQQLNACAEGLRQIVQGVKYHLPQSVWREVERDADALLAAHGEPREEPPNAL